MNKLELNNNELQNTLSKNSEGQFSESAAIVYQMNTQRIKNKASAFGFISTRSGEGTTYGAISIFEALPQILGKEVSAVLVDANINHADLSCQVGFPKRGWAHWLAVKKSYDIKDAVIPWKDTAGSGVLPVGANSGFIDKLPILQFVEVISALKTRFEFVLIDHQPFFCNNLSDQFCVGSDSVIIVLEAEKTRKFLVKKMLEELQKMKIETLGSILNKRRYYIPQWLYERLF